MSTTRIIPPNPLALAALLSPSIDIKYIDQNGNHHLHLKDENHVVEILIAHFPVMNTEINNIYFFNQN
jgi:hypothetical protein